MLNSIKSRTKKILCCFALVLSIFASAFATLQFSKVKQVSAAQSSSKIVEDVTSSLIGSGYNFDMSTGDKPTTSVTGWSKTSDSSSSDNILSGVVSVYETEFSVEDCKTVRPNMPIDKDFATNKTYYKNLMINATNAPYNYGFKRNSTFTLKENSFYRIGVTLYTGKTEKTDDQNETDARASIYLTGLVDEDHEQYDETKFEYITTLGSWVDYYFYIDTKAEASINLELWLGSKTDKVEGAVFFNEVSVLRYSEDAYKEQTNALINTSYDNHNIISLKTETESPVANGSFEDVSLNGWTRTSLTTSSDTAQQYKSVDAYTFANVTSDLTITPPGTNCSVDNQNVLFMYNKNDGYQAIESEEFTVDKHTYYRLSFWAKSDCAKGTGATVKLVDKSETDAAESASLTLATSYSKNSNKFNNDWTKYNFYIYGPSSASKNVAIQIWLGTIDLKTSGYVFVDDFRIEVIDYDTYSANSSNGNSTTFNLNNKADSYVVANGDFDKTQNSTTTDLYPAIPTNWTKTGSDSTTVLSGVINTSNESFDSINFSSVAPANPGILKPGASEDNNVLMIGSTAFTNSQQYSSNSLTLNADSYYSISFYVNTAYEQKAKTNDSNYGARVQLASSTTTVFDLYNIHKIGNFDGNWHRVEVQIKTGANQVTPNINLIFDNTNGYVFFDKFELKTISANLYKNNSFNIEGTQYYYVDLTNETFNNNTVNKVISNLNKLDTPNNWTFNNAENTTNGITAANNSNLLHNIPTSISGNDNYLYISSYGDVYASYTSTQSYTFKASSYYKIQVNVLTQNIGKEEPVEGVEDFGASIALSNSSEILLKNINTNGIWKTYTIYASFTNELSSPVALALGYTNETANGVVLFDNLTITSINESTYFDELDEVDDLSTIATFINYTEPEAESEDDEEKSTWNNEVNWFIIPSIITALAIIIAVVGFYVRKISFNKKPRVKTNYDRRKTLDKDIDKREKIALRQQIIAELRAELDIIDKEIEDFNKLADKHLEEIKQQIKTEQEELQKSKLEIEIRKKEATALREKQLKESPDSLSDKRAEKQYNDFLTKLDKQELSIQKKINAKEMKISTVSNVNKEKLNKYLQRKEYINLQIAKIEAEIEEIARQEEELWAEYRAAKEDAKRRKAEYKAQIKSEKEKAKTQKLKAKEQKTAEPKAKKKTTKKEKVEKDSEK